MYKQQQHHHHHLTFNKAIMLMVLISFMVFISNISSSTVMGATSNGTLREWLSNLNSQAHDLQSTSRMLEKAINVLNSTTVLSTNEKSTLVGKRTPQLEKINNALGLLNQEINVISKRCMQFEGPDCDGVSGVFAAFTNSSILTSATHLNRFMNEIMNGVSSQSGSQPKLLFRASDSLDGFSASAFHTQCDGKGPTIVLVKSTTGAIFGGYTSVSWASVSGGAFVSDPSAFMFSLISSTGDERFTKLTQENGYSFNQYGYTYSIHHDSRYGPTFGGGLDMYMSDNADTVTSSYSDLCYSYCDATMTYLSTTAKSYLTGSLYNFMVSDFEVYTF